MASPRIESEEAALTDRSTTKQRVARMVKYPCGRLSGDHIAKVIPVPFPNTEVKLCEPMIVHTSVKVGIAGFLKTPCSSCCKGFFYALQQNAIASAGLAPVRCVQLATTSDASSTLLPQPRPIRLR